MNHESQFSWQAQYLVMLERVAFVASRVVNDVSYVTRINHDSHFSWQVQYLVMLECHFPGQGQRLVKFGMIAGKRNVYFSIENACGTREK